LHAWMNLIDSWLLVSWLLVSTEIIYWTWRNLMMVGFSLCLLPPFLQSWTWGLPLFSCFAASGTGTGHEIVVSSNNSCQHPLVTQNSVSQMMMSAVTTCLCCVPVSTTYTHHFGSKFGFCVVAVHFKAWHHHEHKSLLREYRTICAPEN
jgi:hypothetical protein